MRSQLVVLGIVAALASCDVRRAAFTVGDTGPRIADSVADFSLMQGNGGWRYLYQEPGQPLKELGDINGMAWWMDYETHWTSIGLYSMHPNVNGKADALGNFPNKGMQYPVRRWTADVASTADIEYAVAKANTLCGDGVIARILVDGVELVEHTIAFNDDTGFSGTLHTPLLVGSNVDLLLEGGPTEYCDETHFVAKVHRTLIHADPYWRSPEDAGSSPVRLLDKAPRDACNHVRRLWRDVLRELATVSGRRRHAGALDIRMEHRYSHGR